MIGFFRRRSFLILYISERHYSKQGFEPNFPKQVFSAIQPTGEIHLGNYLGAIKKWVQLQSSEKNLFFSIADLHSLSLPQDPKILHENIFLMAATLLACGIDPNKSVFFQQSDVHQHSELCWIFGTLSTMARLSHLPQFKEKSQSAKEIPVGIFMYPVLQVADIALYKSTHVPVGNDQLKHVELANHLIRTFNRKFGNTFPHVNAITDEQTGSIKSLTDPDKKMSKSSHPKSRINLTDSPDQILTKCKKALTDFSSRVTYEPGSRPGVSNLVLIHSLLANKSTETICQESQNLDTGEYKLVLAEFIIEALKPVRMEIQRYLTSPEYLENVLSAGADKATEIAECTLQEVKHKVGLKTELDMLLKAKSKQPNN